MDAYVINLDKRPDRWQKMQEDWKDFNLIRVSAVEDNIGFVGCAKSHLSLVKYAKDNNMPYILVLEDDATPTKHFKTYWKRCLNYLDDHSDEWDIFNGGPVAIYKNTIKKLTSHFYKTDSALAIHFVIYNKKCYDRVLSWNDLPVPPEKRPEIDAYLSWPNLSLTTYGVYPFISIQRAGYSDIDKTESNRLKYYKRLQDRVAKILKSD